MANKVTLDTAGNMWKVLVAEGDSVKKGDVLFIMEIMKMEVPYEAPADGKITAIHIAEGDADLEEDMVALEIE